jgi:hypothetical protein
MRPRLYIKSVQNPRRKKKKINSIHIYRILQNLQHDNIYNFCLNFFLTKCCFTVTSNIATFTTHFVRPNLVDRVKGINRVLHNIHNKTQLPQWIVSLYQAIHSKHFERKKKLQNHNRNFIRVVRDLKVPT